MRFAESVSSRFGILLFAVTILGATIGSADAGEAAEAVSIYRIDPDLTSAQFAVSHLGLSMQRGHFGRTRGTLRVARLDCGRDSESGREGCGAEVDATIKRSDFSMSYAQGIVGDDIGLSFQVTAFRVSSDDEADQP